MKPMTIVKYLSVLSLGGCAALLSLPAYAGWYGGDCDYHYSQPNSGVCIEYTDENGEKWHMNSHGGTPSYKGPFAPPLTPTDGVYSSGPMDNFVFRGQTDLSCFNGLVTLTCDLELEGKVKKDGTNVNIEIVDGDAINAYGDSLCNSVVIGDFPWYIGPNNPTAPVPSSHWDGITIGGTPIIPLGSVGSLGFQVENPVWPYIPPFLVDITDAHINDVAFSNQGTGPSTFSFDQDILNNSDGSSTGCHIDGVLEVQNGVDVDIYYQ